MPKLNGYICRGCGKPYDYIHMNAEDVNTCPECGSSEADETLGGHTLTTIIPTYRNCKRVKAGYTHSHGDRPAEKISVSVPTNLSTGEK